MTSLPPIGNSDNGEARRDAALNPDWLGRNDLLAILPDYIVDQILRGAYHYDFSGNPVVHVDELSDRVGLVLRDHNITEGTA